MSDAKQQNAGSQRSWLPFVAAIIIVSICVAYLHLIGRVWWCACGTPTLFVVDPTSAHNSQHLVDWYAASHLLHGVLFYWVLWWLAPKLSIAWRLVIAVAVEAAWEALENSPIIIARYRETASLGYEGDSIVNTLGDLGFCVAGFWLAKAIGLRASAVLFVALELLLLFAIRDNLTLNVIMLLYPFESIRAWQLG
jgi:hypothetical protein